MMVSFTKSELETIRDSLKSQIDCEKEALIAYPDEHEATQNYWRTNLKNWISIRKKLKKVMKK